MIHQKIDIRVDGSMDYAALYTYVQDYKEEVEAKERPMILLCPGGGYFYTSDREAEPIATKLLAAGFHVCILRYSCAPAVFPTALLEAATAMKIIRSHVKDWHIKEDKVFIMGASAGGHLSANLAIFQKRDWVSKSIGCTPDDIKINGMILMYPVITSGEFAHRSSFELALDGKYTEENLELMSLEKQVDENTPPAFIWHTYTDDLVPVENSFLLISAMKKYNIPVEFHMYPRGGHGLATADYETNWPDLDSRVVESCSGWLDLAIRWVKLF